MFTLEKVSRIVYICSIMTLIFCGYFITQEKIKLAEQMGALTHLFLFTGFCFNFLKK